MLCTGCGGGEPCQPGELEGEPHLRGLICILPWAALPVIAGLESVQAAPSLGLPQHPLGPGS